MAELFKMGIDALSSVWDSIIKNWVSFLILVVAYTVLIICIFRIYYKNKAESLKDLQNSLEREKQQLLQEKDEISKIKEDNERLNLIVNSQEYQTYKLSRNLEKDKLDDSNMFCKKK